MRCKNCGSENDDNLYICQNCGSPLYDEEDIKEEGNTNNTRVFNTVDTPDNNYSEPIRHSSTQNNKKEEERKKQTIIVIIILAIILVAIIAGTIIAVANNKKDDTTTVTDTPSVSDETSDDLDDNFVSQQTTSEKTTKTTAKQTTTESTTKETTTKIKTFSLSLSCNDGGEVEGDGTYKRGDNITVIARPDDGYDFDGWYNGDKKVSSNTKYTFTITDNTNLQAVFVIVNDEPIESLDGGED